MDSVDGNLPADDGSADFPSYAIAVAQEVEQYSTIAATASRDVEAMALASALFPGEVVARVAVAGFEAQISARLAATLYASYEASAYVQKRRRGVKALFDRRQKMMRAMYSAVLREAIPVLRADSSPQCAERFLECLRTGNASRISQTTQDEKRTQ